MTKHLKSSLIYKEAFSKIKGARSSVIVLSICKRYLSKGFGGVGGQYDLADIMPLAR
jgi:hypothetical protein